MINLFSMTYVGNGGGLIQSIPKDERTDHLHGVPIIGQLPGTIPEV